MSFNNIKEFAEADERGQTWVTSFRKLVASAATPTSGWIDYLYYAGSPPANFYASAPYVSEVVESNKGIYVPSVAPATQHIRNLTTLSAAASATATSSQRQRLLLADYLLYYPFIDTDAVGEEQAMENIVVCPRQGWGQVIAVSQSAASAVGQFTMNYTNEAGVAGRVSQNTYTISTLAGGGQVATSAASANGYHPFINLQGGDRGVSSIQSVTFTAAGGGLMALVIVKPIMDHIVTQECRRETSGGLNSFGAADRFDAVIHRAGSPQIPDGAVLGVFGQGFAGSLASSTLVGLLETVWQ